MTPWAALKFEKFAIFAAFFKNVRVDLEKMVTMTTHGVVAQLQIRQIKADEKLDGGTLYDQLPSGSFAAASLKKPIKWPNVKDSEVP